MKLKALALCLTGFTSLPALTAAIKTEEVVISASKTAVDPFLATKDVSVVEHDKMVSSGRDNLPEMLSDETSVSLETDGTPGVKRISLRNESASRTLLLVDGIRVDDFKTKSGAPVLVNPYFVDRVEILRGPSSVLYGSDALGGVVQVITKDYSDKSLSFETGAMYTSAHEGFSEFLNASGSYRDFHYKLGAFGSDMGDVYLSGHERLDNTSYRQKGFNAAFAYDFSRHFTAELTHEYFNVSARTASDSTDSQYEDFTANIPKWRREKTVLNLKFNQLSDVIEKADLSFYLQENDKDFNSQVSAAGPFVYAENRQDTFGALGQIDLNLSDTFYLITGFEVREDKLKSDSGASLSIGDVGIYDRDLKQDTYALYALLRTFITDDLTLETGLRYTYMETRAGSSTMSMQTRAGDFSLGNTLGTDRDDSFLVGSIGLNYIINDENAVRFSYSQGYRAPNLQELYLTTFTGQMQSGNPNLKEETSDSFELGFRHESDLGDLDANLFYTMADDYIDTVHTGSYSVEVTETLSIPTELEAYYYRNISKAVSYGLELTGRLYLGNFTPYLNTTIMRRQYKTDSGSTYDTGTPLLKGRAGVRFDDNIWANPYYVDLFTRFATECDNDNLDGASYFDDYHFSGYVTLNLALGMNFLGESLKIFGTFENIFDEDYRTSELISEPGRFFTLGFSYTY